MTVHRLARIRLLIFIFSTSMLVACGGGKSDSNNGNDSGNVITRSTVSQVATPMDDVEEQANGSLSVASSDLELINDGDAQTVGVRFVVSVPQNATITNAYIQFTVDEVTTTETNLQINGEASADAAAFASTTNNVSARLATSASVNWNPPAWNTVGNATVAQRTPDLSAIVQEIVDISGWSQNNHIVLMFTGTGRRTAVSRDNSLIQAPALHVEYEIEEGAGGGGGANNAPSISGSPASNVALGGSYSFTPTVVDSDLNDTLMFSINNPPDWANFDATTGILSGTPAVGDTGTTTSNIIISVSDGTDSAALAAFSITVTNDTPPVAVDDNVVGTEDNVSIIAVLANDTDAENDTLNILSVTQPVNGGASISGRNVTYSPNANYFGTDTFTYTADDGMGGSDTATVTIVVEPVNDTPIAQPDSANVTQGNTVTIALLGNDTGLGDGSIVVSITSATSSGILTNNNDGTISYTPNTNFTGTDNFVYQIIDADGQTSTANGTITVEASGGSTGTAILSWLMPSTREDASSISPSEIAGYRIYHGTNAGNLTLIDTVTDSSVTEYTVGSLATGIHYFSVTTYDVDGSESDYSNIGEKFIN
ncbi:MAG: tandem-95 repeat protein [Gammaproteobacteria bacterium]|nr:tandem-95 repeat protein [Gammaproteobacteria bacterium]